jgi:hypothetical protein
VQHVAVCARELGKKALEDLAAGGTVQKKQTEIVKPRALYFSAELIKVEAMEDTDIARVGSQIVSQACPTQRSWSRQRTMTALHLSSCSS